MPSKQVIIPVLLCGGSGSRLWPVSRESYPKQFISINKEETKTLLQITYERIKNLDNLEKPILISNEELRFIVAQQIKEINIKPNSITLEPVRRNTAPAITTAALKSIEKYDDPILLVMSSDHEIKNIEKFLLAIKEGLKYVREGRLVTFGVVPKYPETGYGYIKSKDNFEKSKLKGLKIDKFIEKPDLSTAKMFVKDKHYTWNSGIFLFKAKKIIKEIKSLSPFLFKNCNDSLLKSKLDLDFQRLDNDSFSKCPDISIDVAIMEKTTLGTVIPLEAGWNDIGNWKAIWDISNKNNDGNAISGNVILKNSKNSLLRSENRLIVGLGIENLIVVETLDAILISHKDHAQKVKNIVEELKENGLKVGKEHKQIFRPWGNYTSIAEDKNWKVKKILVNPGQSLSLQKHNHRSEHWIVLIGTAKVEIDGKLTILKENSSIYIPHNTKHRLSNPYKNSLVIIEVQSGNYLGEDDIERFEDIYGRIE